MVSIARIKSFIRILIGILLGLYIGLLVLLNIPFVQKRLAAFASHELGHVLHTEVSVGHVDIGFYNRIIIENVQLNDQQGNE
jgi:ABC-type lipoprotein release transport system permease subunit